MTDVTPIPPAYAHQREGFKLALRGSETNPAAYCLNMDMGAGKSRVAIRVWWNRVTRGVVEDLLIVAPIGCYLNWSSAASGSEDPGEFERWFTPEEYDRLKIVAWTGSGGVARQRSLDRFLKYDGEKARVLLVNVEALSSEGRAREVVRAYLGSRRVMFLIDEPACIMHFDTARTKFVHGLARKASYRMITTGLLAPEEPLNVFSQFWFLDPQILGHRDFYSFRSHYAVTRRVDYQPADLKESRERRPPLVVDLYYHRQTEKAWQVARSPNADPIWLIKKFARRETPRPGGAFSFRVSMWHAEEVGLVEMGRRGVEVVVSYKNQDELARRVASASYRVETRDVLDLPPQVYMPVRWVEMTAEQERMYEQVRRAAHTEFEGKFVEVATVMDQLGKLQSILCGHVRTEEGEVLDVPSNRVDAVMQVIQDTSKKVVVWAPYPRLLEKVTDALRTAYGERSTLTFWGATGKAERIEAKSRIQRDETARFIVGNQAVGGEGNNWTAASLTVYAANSPKNKDRQQSERRTWRSGQRETCVYVDLAVRGTVDERWVQVIRRKMDLSAALTGDRWREWLV